MRTWKTMLALGLLAVTQTSRGSAPLRWDPTTGISWQLGKTMICWGGSGSGSTSLLLRFPASELVRVLPAPSVNSSTPNELVLSYQTHSPEGTAILIERRVHQVADHTGSALLETFTLTPERPLTNDVEVEIPFVLPATLKRAGISLSRSSQLSVTCPLKNGWAKSFPLGPAGTRFEYRLGSFLTGNDTPALALPVVPLLGQSYSAALFADPTFSTLFTLHPGSVSGQVNGSLRFRYAASKVPISGSETRTFAIWLPNSPRPANHFTAALDAWFRLMLPDVPPGPQWLHDIAMVDYDFLSDDGRGWERDLRTLASWLKPAERRRVALCLHGWYDALGSYCFDAQGRCMKQEWIAFERTRKVKFTQTELKRRLHLATDLGFHVLLYFGDGLAADSGVPGYRDDWAYRDARGNKITGWQGPDTFGPTYMLNPAHPQVSAWFTNYMSALLQTYGADTEGFVWDETFHAPLGQIASAPMPGYCDRAMLALVKALTQQVHAYDPKKVFLASDCIGIPGFESIPGYAMVASGTYQDTHCDSVAWSYGLFPNWRNTFWSCNWADVSGFHNSRWGVRQFGVPVAISNGWADDCGPSEWTPRQRDQILRLFRERLKLQHPVRFLTQDPAALAARAPDHCAPGDPRPALAAGEVNWALAAHGARASASSFDQIGTATWPAAGVIDGRRDDTGWSNGHGWASRGGAPLPQWLQVEFLEPHHVQRLIISTYQKENSAETAGKWGLQDYTIEAWLKGKWKRIATSSEEFPGKVRVHKLPHPVLTDKLRLVVQQVAPLDGQARVLQLEAWGTR